MSKQGGGSLGMALVLLLVLMALGGWNYHRNYQIEQSERSQSTFSSYPLESLEQLVAAYRLEAEALQQRYDRLHGQRAKVRSTQGVEAGVQEFERVQRVSRQRREVTTELATREARIREIEAELAQREGLGSGFALHFSRLTGLALPI